MIPYSPIFGQQTVKASQAAEMSFFKKHIALFLLILSIVFFIAGIMLEEPAMILSHAIRICLGCIGIG
jgi:hypothetical protein